MQAAHAPPMRPTWLLNMCPVGAMRAHTLVSCQEENHTAEFTIQRRNFHVEGCTSGRYLKTMAFPCSQAVGSNQMRSRHLLSENRRCAACKATSSNGSVRITIAEQRNLGWLHDAQRWPELVAQHRKEFASDLPLGTTQAPVQRHYRAGPSLVQLVPC